MASAREFRNYVLLQDAIKKRDKETAKTLILNNVNVKNSRLKYNTLLHWAIIQFEDLDIMKLLLDKGANIHTKNQQNLKPLDIAIENNKTQAALLLIESGALVGEDLNLLLIKAIKQQNYTIFKALFDNRMQSNQDIKIDFDLLFKNDIFYKNAISRGHPQIFEYILPHCQFLETSDKYIPRELVIKAGYQYKECVEVLFKWNFTINPTSNQDKDFVYGAVKYGHLQIVIQLLKLGINVKLAKSKIELNLLKIACFNKHHEIVEHLLEHNSCLNVITSNDPKMIEKYKCHDTHKYNCPYSFLFDQNDACGRICLQIAVRNSDPKMTKLLLKYGAKIVDDLKFFHITCMAVRNNCEENVRIFLDNGVDVNDIDSEERTLLHFCVFCSNHDAKYNIAKLLVEKGATIYLQKQNNPLFFEAVKNGHRKIAQLFLNYNANTQYISPEGNTSLHKAIKRNFDVDFIENLLKLNVPVNTINHKMLTPLLMACKIESENQSKIIELLLQHNADVDCYDDCLMTPLHIACENQNLKVITIFLKTGVNINAINDEGQTPFHLVCKYKNDNTTSIMELFLEYNANIDAADARGWTPLFMACEAGNDIAVKILLEHHVDANHTDLENLTPLYIAAKHCRYNSEIVKMLLRHKVNVHCINKWGKSVIHVIVENNNAELIKFIARTEINFNTLNKEGNTPLHIAVKNKCIDVTENLTKYGSNVNILDKKNRTPLKKAILWRNNFQYEAKRNEIEKIIKILKVQIVKLKVAGLKVNKQNLKLTYDPERDSDNESFNQNDLNDRIDITQLEDDCEKEIQKMIEENIDVCDMTFYDILKKNIHLLSRHVRNHKIQQTLDLEIYDEKFPLYINIVRNRFRDAKLRYRFMDAAKKHFSSSLCFQLSDDCVDMVLSYLSIKEIKMVIRSLRPPNK